MQLPNHSPVGAMVVPIAFKWSRATMVAGLVALFGGCVEAPHGVELDRPHRTKIGLCEDYPGEHRSIAAARRDLALAHASGAQVLRIAFAWDEIEPERGRYDWTFWDDFVREAVDVYHITLIPYVCYTPKWAATNTGDDFWRSPLRDPHDFAEFVGVIVRRYHDRIHSWELWNEPDNSAYWLGTPDQFAALVRAGSEAVRAADPEATVVLGGIAGEIDFLATLFRADRIGPAIDAVNIHSYFETWHPSPIEHIENYVASAENVIREAGGHQALWMAETGYSSVGDRPETSAVYRPHFRGEHTGVAQARAVARTLIEGLATEQLAVIAWYRINDLNATQNVIGDDNNRHLGVRAYGGGHKLALSTFAYLARLFDQPYERIAVTTSVGEAARGVPVVRAFRLRDGRRVVAAWLGVPDEPAPAVPAPDDRSATVVIHLTGERPRSVRVSEAAGAEMGPSPAHGYSSHSTDLQWTLRGAAVIIAELSP